MVIARTIWRRAPNRSHHPRRMPLPTTDAQALAEQLLLGRYRVLETRGEGGFGTV